MNAAFSELYSRPIGDEQEKFDEKLQKRFPEMRRTAFATNFRFCDGTHFRFSNILFKMTFGENAYNLSCVFVVIATFFDRSSFTS